jgi:3-oxosteroid 1-dehydrogenase
MCIGHATAAQRASNAANGCGPCGRLDATIERFNGFARAGVDDDFRRGTGVAEYSPEYG